MAQRFKLNKNFNIASTTINENVRVSTASIFYENEWFGSYYQMETFIFRNDGIRGNMKIHNVPCNDNGIDYCKRFHNKVVYMLNKKLK